MQKHPGGIYLKFSDEIGELKDPGRIVQEYHNSAAEFKTVTFGDGTDKSLLDHHKIAAMYTRAFLAHKPFYSDIPPESKKVNPCKYVVFANEYFTIALLSSIFKAWDKYYNHGVCNKTLQMLSCSHYREHFIKLMYHYKTDIHRINLPSFANIIYLIEQHYFK